MYVLAIRDQESFRLIERETGYSLYLEEMTLHQMHKIIANEGNILKLVHGIDYHPVYGPYREGFFWPSGNWVASLPADWYMGVLHPGDVRFHPLPDETFLQSEWTGSIWINEQIVRAPLTEGVYNFLLAPGLSEHNLIDFSLSDHPTADRYYRPRQTVINNRLVYERNQGKS